MKVCTNVIYKRLLSLSLIGFLSVSLVACESAIADGTVGEPTDFQFTESSDFVEQDTEDMDSVSFLEDIANLIYETAIPTDYVPQKPTDPSNILLGGNPAVETLDVAKEGVLDYVKFSTKDALANDFAFAFYPNVGKLSVIFGRHHMDDFGVLIGFRSVLLILDVSYGSFEELLSLSYWEGVVDTVKIVTYVDCMNVRGEILNSGAEIPHSYSGNCYGAAIGYEERSFRLIPQGPVSFTDPFQSVYDRFSVVIS